MCNMLVCYILSPIAATRETSFVHAISAAGVMYTLTKNCSMGDFDNCGCDDSRIGQTGNFFNFVPNCLVFTIRLHYVTLNSI